MSRARSSFVVLAFLAVVALVAACGDDGTPVKDASAAKDKSIPTLSVPVDAAGKKCVAATGIPKKEGKPTEIDMPVGELPPTKLVKKDLKVGTGAEAKKGDAITVNYVGVACSTGKQFDSSWDSGKPFDATLTDGGLIQGWIDGIPGMKVGGRRMLIIPSDLAYGATGSGDIAKNEALVFVIDLEKTGPPPSTTTSAPAASTTTTAPADSSTTTASTTTTEG